MNYDFVRHALPAKNKNAAEQEWDERMCVNRFTSSRKKSQCHNITTKHTKIQKNDEKTQKQHALSTILI